MKILQSKLSALINRERRLRVSSERLTQMIGRHGLGHATLTEEIIDNLLVTIVPGHIEISGRFQRDRWSGLFHLCLRPIKVIWNEQQHALFFELRDHDVQFDRSLHGVLASIGLATINGLFGKNYILNKTVTAIRGNQVEIDLGHLDPMRQPVWEAFTLHRLECMADELHLVFSTHPRKVLKSIGQLVVNRIPK
jgi:hypothetical protein